MKIMECGSLTDKEIFSKYLDTLRLLEDERVVSFYAYEDGVHLEEMCDEHFSVRLNKKICDDLSKLFKDLGEIIED